MFARIDDNGVVMEDEIVVFPAVEVRPIVCSYDECKLILGVGFMEFTKRIIGI